MPADKLDEIIALLQDIRSALGKEGAARREAGSGNTRRGPTRFPRIGAACEALGVSRTHLYYVLTGARRSPRLLRRYNAFVAG